MALPEKLYDVAVVGSGPAGSSAACRLAKHGLDVALFEKASLPRYKTCGGGIVRRASKLLPVDIQHIVERDCHSAELHFVEQNLHFTTQRQEPIISMIMRQDFDFFLAAAAQRAGASLFAPCEVLDISSDNGTVQLGTTEGAVKARFAIAADGAAGVVARKASRQAPQRVIPALECEVHVHDSILERFSSARFDFGIVPNGYAWVFPKKNHLSIGVLSTKKHSMNLRKAITKYLQVLGIEAVDNMEQHGFMLPFGRRARSFVHNRVLLVGDAAGFVDPLTCEGITYAIQSGQLAADAIAKSRLDGALVRDAYHKKLRAEILPELRYAYLLALLVYGESNLKAWLFRTYGQRLCEAVADIVTGKRTYRSIFYNPATYLKLLHFRNEKDGGIKPRAEEVLGDFRH